MKNYLILILIMKKEFGKLNVILLKILLEEMRTIYLIFFENIFKEVNPEKENEINFKEFKNLMYINYFISL